MSDRRVAFANFSESGSVFVEVGRGIAEAAGIAGINLEVYNNDMDASTTLANARTIVQTQPDAVIEYNAVPDTGQRIADQFSDAGIPCVAVNIPMGDGCAWLNYDSVALQTDLGNTLADMMDERGWDTTNTTIVLMQDSIAGPAINASIWNAYSAISARIDGVDPISASDMNSQMTTIDALAIQVDAGSSNETGFTAVSRALASIPEGNNLVMFSTIDDSMVGGHRALEAAGRDGNAMLAGFDGTDVGLEALRTVPAWVAESDMMLDIWGPLALAMTDALIAGESAPDLTVAPSVVLTKDNLETYYADGSNVATSVPELDPSTEWIQRTGFLEQFEAFSR